MIELHIPYTRLLYLHVQSSVLDQPHPDWKYPLQFVITSLEMGEECKWTSDKALQKSAEAEVETVKDLVQQCVDNWPAEWGVKKLSLICVMTRTKFAVSDKINSSCEYAILANLYIILILFIS